MKILLDKLLLMLFGLYGSSTAAVVNAIEGIIKRLKKTPGAEAEILEFGEMLSAAGEIKTDSKLKLLTDSLEPLFKFLINEPFQKK